MVKILSSRVAVMYLGEFVEIGPVEEIYAHPHHPYTQILLGIDPPSRSDSRGRTNANHFTWRAAIAAESAARVPIQYPLPQGPIHLF